MPLRVSNDARAPWGIQVNFAFSASGYPAARSNVQSPKATFDLNLTAGRDVSIGGKQISLACPFTRFSRVLS
jgi:hypothetical protein